MKKIFVVAFLSLLVFLIYLTTIDKKVYYLSLGDSLAQGVTPYNSIDYGYTDYVKDYLTEKKILEKSVFEFAQSNYRITDMIRDIEDNKKVISNGKEVTLKNALIKSDLLTLSIGMSDFLAKFDFGNFLGQIDSAQTYQYIDEISADLDKLLSLIRMYCKEDIILIGYYNPIPFFTKDVSSLADEVFTYAREKQKLLCEKYHVMYVDIYDVFLENPDFLPNPFNIHPSKAGYQAISDAIIVKINESLLK